MELVHSLLEDPSERKYFFQVRAVQLPAFADMSVLVSVAQDRIIYEPSLLKRIIIIVKRQQYPCMYLSHFCITYIACSPSALSLPQECFPDHFGSKFETALEMLVWEFISRLDELLPVPDFTQVQRESLVLFLTL